MRLAQPEGTLRFSCPILGFPNAESSGSTPSWCTPSQPNKAYPPTGIPRSKSKTWTPSTIRHLVPLRLSKMIKAQGKNYYMRRSLLMLRTHERFKHALERLELLEQRLWAATINLLQQLVIPFQSTRVWGPMQAGCDVIFLCDANIY